ncbi:MAG: ribosome rescue protein RqcH [Thermoplasmata archaeon]
MEAPTSPPKTELTAFDVLALVDELRGVVGGFVEKVFQPSDRELFLRLRTPGRGRVELVVEEGRWLYTRDRSQEELPPPPAFAMLLRKHLENQRLRSVEQRGFERLVVLGFEDSELVLELFGEGNIVLVRNGTIVQPLREEDWEHRRVRRGQPYLFPPARTDPRTLGEKELLALLRASKADLVRTLAVSVNLGGRYAEEVCARTGLERSLKAARLPATDAGGLIEAITSLFDEVSSRRSPVVLLEGEIPVDFTPIPLRIDLGRPSRCLATVNDAISFYVGYWREKKRFEERRRGIGEELERLRRQIESQRRAIEACEQQARAGRQVAGELSSRAEELERLLEELRRLHASGGWESVQEALSAGRLECVREARPHAGTVVLELEAGQAELDIRRSARENISAHFEKAKQASEKAQRASKALEEAMEKLRSLEARGEAAAGAPGPVAGAGGPEKKRRTKPFWFERYRWFISSEGFLVLAGRDASSNERLVKRHMKEGDFYAHADLHGAPSVVVKASERRWGAEGESCGVRREGEEGGGGGSARLPEQTLREACLFALACSKAWAAGLASGSAYWVRPEQVSKTPESGEYLPKGAFVVRGRKNFLHNLELRLAIGWVEHEGERLLMCGPESALRKHSRKIAGIQPGQDEAITVARRLARELECTPEEVLRLLPPGRSQVVLLPIP